MSTTKGARPDTVVEEIQSTRLALRERARRQLGVVGESGTSPLRAVLRDHSVAIYPVVAIGLLGITDQFQGYALSVLAPDISSSLGIGIGGVAAVTALAGLAQGVAPLPMARLSQQGRRRAALCIITGIGWALMTLYTGFVTSLTAVLLVLLLDGLTTGSASALHGPLLMDSYPPEARVRVLSTYGAFGRSSGVLAPLLVALVAGPLDFTWRGVFIFLGLICLVVSLFSIRLRDPGFGRWDTEVLREDVRQLHGATATTDHDEDDVSLGFWEICRRVMLIPTNRRVIAGFTVLGLLAVPLNTYISFFLDERWHLSAAGRGLFFGYYAAVQVVALLIYGRRGESLFRKDPAALMRWAGITLGAGIILIGVGGLSPWFWLMVALFGVSACAIATLLPVMGLAVMSVIPARMRPHVAALTTISSGLGGLVGALFFAGIDRRFGAGGTMVAVMIPGAIGALLIASSSRLIDTDMDRMIDEVLEDEEINQLVRSGARPSMLACRGVDFSYGQVQVLFGVDFTVDEGELVALLGVNGAGKSTILKVISGIGIPSAGSVRFRGQDITYLDAERRLNLGITQIPGGRAVFGSLTVAENLRSFGFSVRKNRRVLDQAIEHCFDVFPRLAERRNSLASTLSGGEQQMLGLSKAFILKPKLLLIDELSLGLAPVIVGQLLELVREINAGGTAVVLVEQSVNIALSLADHAYFMEKGEIRFDGASRDLLERGDLLRAVFLEGVAAGGSR